MEIIRTVKRLEEALGKARSEGLSIGLVPTMGALHAGHKSLVDCARAQNDVVVVSVFVNPTQFNNAADLATYPRTEAADEALLDASGVDYMFLPSVEEVYPQPDTRVFNLGPVAEVMEGPMRPGHFNGVCQIVSKLFGMVKPHRAYFGEKDFQQIAVIRRMVELEDEVVRQINSLPGLTTVYFSIVDAITMQPLAAWESAGAAGAVGCVTVYCGDVRLIDNIRY